MSDYTFTSSDSVKEILEQINYELSKARLSCVILSTPRLLSYYRAKGYKTAELHDRIAIVNCGLTRIK